MAITLLPNSATEFAIWNWHACYINRGDYNSCDKNYGVPRNYGYSWSIICSGSATPKLLRIIVDAISDPKTHNLWPFELIISSIVGLVVGAASAGIGNLTSSLHTGKIRDE